MNRRGFTLMEVIIVLALMGILMAMATPSLVAWRESAQNKEVARDILAGLRQARSLAITESRNVIVNIDPASRELIIDGRDRPLAGNATLETNINDLTTWDSGVLTLNFNAQGSYTPNVANTATEVERVFIRVNAQDRLIIEIPSRASGLARIN